jgi:tetratricopeptide (TPR) repeat protein
MRYVGYLTFALNYRLHGLNVSGYHMANLIIHIVNALLIYFFVILSFETPFLSKSELRSYSRQIAVFVALLFACHPIQTEAVTYIWQRVTSLFTMFYLFSLVAYCKWRLLIVRPHDSHGEKFLNARSLFLYVASLIFAALAMKTKEIAFTLPVMIVLYEFIFFKGNIKRRILNLIPFLFTMLIIPVSLIGIDKPIGDLIGNVDEATRVQTTMSRMEYLFTEFRILITYIRLLFFPINQNLDYDYAINSSFFSSHVLLSFLFLLSVFWLAGYLLYRYRDTATHARFIAFGIFWFFTALSVESSIIPIVDVIFEHRMYLPSIGIFIAMGTSIPAVVGRLKMSRRRMEFLVIGSLAVTVLMLTGLTYARNSVWKDKLSLWEDVISKGPEKARGHNNLGIAYQGKGLLDGAKEQFQIAIKLDSAYSIAHHNLAVAYHSQGIIDRALEHYQFAIELAPFFPEAYNNRGNAYKSQGLYDKAIENYETAIRLKPNWEAPHYKLVSIYLERGEMDQAIRVFKRVMQINPKYDDAGRFFESNLMKNGDL